MKKLFLLSLLLTAFTGYCQGSPEGKWYLVTRNNLRLIEIRKDTICTTTLEDFSLSEREDNTPNEILIVTNKKQESDKAFWDVRDKKDTEPVGTFIFQKDTSKKYPVLRMSVKPKDIGSTIKEETFQLVTAEEVKGYSNLKPLAQMTEKDFIDFGNYLLALKEKIKQEEEETKTRSSRHFIFSEVKYKLVSLGYNPLITFNELEEIFTTKFADNSKASDMYLQINE